MGHSRVRAGRDRGLGRAGTRVRRPAGRVARVVHAEIGQPGRRRRPRAHEPPDQRLPRAPVDPRAHAGDRARRATSTSPSNRSGTPPSRIAGARFVELPGSEHFPWVGDRGRDPRRGGALRGRARRGGGASSTGCWRRCCSPTSSGRPRRPPSSAIERWKELVEEHHRRGARPARPVPRRGGRHGGRRVLRHVRRPGAGGPVRAVDRRRGARRSASRSGRACTPARSRRSTGRSAGWPW